MNEETHRNTVVHTYPYMNTNTYTVKNSNKHSTKLLSTEGIIWVTVTFEYNYSITVEHIANSKNSRKQFSN